MLQDSVHATRSSVRKTNRMPSSAYMMSQLMVKRRVFIGFPERAIDSEWNHSEKNGGKTFMGDVISGVTRALVDTQNKVLYGKDDEQK